MDSNSHQSYELQQQQQYQHHHHHHHHHQQQQQHNSGLLRLSCASNSLLADFIQSSESERLALRFVNRGDSNDMASPRFQEFEDKASKEPNESSAMSRMNSRQSYGGLPSQYPIQRHNSAASSAMDSSYGLVGSHLPRQSSFPAVGGLFSSNTSFQNGYDTVKGVGSYCGVNGSDVQLSPSMNRLKNQISFSSSRSPSSMGMLSQISKISSESIGASTSPDDGRKGGSNGDAQYDDHGFPYASWNDTSNLSENPSGLKRKRSSNGKLFSDAQNGELGNQVHILSHHLSLPKTSAEMVAMENLLQFSDSVPCKIRAKRGCATHPRSIAERVRRTRISERMRKLQELVPNMDKQTSTADMLGLAIEYIKDLQRQFKTLSEKRVNCKCISMQKSDRNQIA